MMVVVAVGLPVVGIVYIFYEKGLTIIIICKVIEFVQSHFLDGIRQFLVSISTGSL